MPGAGTPGYSRRVQESLRATFEAVIHGAAAVDLAAGALAIARIGDSELAPGPWLRRLDAIAAELRADVAAGNDGIARARRVLAGLAALGFRGNQDDYYDPRNSFLDQVLVRRTGIPISLAVVAIEVGRRLGVPLAGIAFPGHFLVATDDQNERTFFDPFHGGIEIDTCTMLQRLGQLARQAGRSTPGFVRVPDELVAPAEPTAILARMLRNLVRIYVERADDARALAAVDLLLVVTPDARDDLRTRGLLYERLGCSAAAAADLRRYLELAPGAPDAAAIELRAAKLADVSPTLH